VTVLLTRLALAGMFAAAMALELHAQGSPEPAPAAANLVGLHDFDFQVGDWRVHHRVKRPTGSDPWLEFEGTCSNRGLMDGWANVEDHTFNKPNGVSHGVGLRAYDPKTGQWAIWWIDGRAPHGNLDPPVKGRFDKGVGTFYSDYVDQGKPMRVRFIWSNITSTSARWEQAFSSDAGATWETNWTMDFRRAS
jgi:uncharacterized protein DUF1579